MSAENDPPLGQLYTRVYVERGKPRADNDRMRRRLAAALRDLGAGFGCSDLITEELGIDVPHGMHAPNWERFCKECSLADLLDSITIVYRQFRGERYTDEGRWIKACSRILAEQNVAYRIDAHGGVHPHPDDEFARSVASTIAALGHKRFANARNAFEEAIAALAKIPPDGRDSIRRTFDAAEGLFRLMFPDERNLNQSAAGRLLGPIERSLHEGDKAALGAAENLLAAFQRWIDAAHFYRHEQGREEPKQPAPEQAVHLVSLGASFVRWLADLDPATTKAP